MNKEAQVTVASKLESVGARHDKTAGHALQGEQERAVSICVTMLGIVGIGTWLRFRNLSADSIWLDEAVSWLQAKGSLADLISATAQGIQSPLHNLLLFAFMNLSGTDTEWALRAPSALLGIGNIVAIYWLGVLIGGRTRWRVGGSNFGDIRFSHLLLSRSSHVYAARACRDALRSRCVLFCEVSDAMPVLHCSQSAA